MRTVPAEDFLKGMNALSRLFLFLSLIAPAWSYIGSPTVQGCHGWLSASPFGERSRCCRDRLRGGGRGGAAGMSMFDRSGNANRKQKTIIWIRHGVTEMNVFLMSNGYGTDGFTDPGFWDTKLTRNGEKQAKKINDNIQKLGHIDLIVCSPLTRALKTANIAFEGTSIPRVVNADIRERMWLSSDVGTAAHQLKKEFDHETWDFSELSDVWWYTDEKWKEKPDWRQPGTYVHAGEPEDAFRERLERFKDWIKERPEDTIAVVAHWGTINALTGLSLDNCEVKKGTLSQMMMHKMHFTD